MGGLLARFWAPSWGQKLVQEPPKRGSKIVVLEDVESAIFYHPYQGFGRFGASSWASKMLDDRCEFGSDVVLKSRANSERLGGRSGAVLVP